MNRLYIKFDQNGECLAYAVVDTEEPMQLDFFEVLPESFLEVEHYDYIRKTSNGYIYDDTIKLFVKFDENGKLVSYGRFNKKNEIRPDSAGFEQTTDVADEDIRYLIKVDGVIKIDEERKTTDLENVKNAELNAKYIPTENASLKVFAKSFLNTMPLSNASDKILESGLYDQWTLGNYVVGDIRNYAGQTWECHQAHDNAIYPDIIPTNAQTWATFWHPLHGTTVETARPWTKPWAGTTDMYHTGEYMIFTDDKVYKCKSDTVYSPEEYAAAWEVVE